MHDSEMFPNPDEFNPDRFLQFNDGKLEINRSLSKCDEGNFGFGRRICPGRHLALSSIFINIASVVAAFTLEKARDKDGNVIELSGEYTSGLIA